MPVPEANKALLGVFSSNRVAPIHRWYPFVEGYSKQLVERAIVAAPRSAIIMDPFAGSGTTLVAASAAGITSYYTEANPFMSWVTGVKTTSTRKLIDDDAAARLLRRFAGQCRIPRKAENAERFAIYRINKTRSYFMDDTLAGVINSLELASELPPKVRDHARLAIAAALVPSSNMIRRTDLRRRTDRDRRPLPFTEELAVRLEIMATDIEKLSGEGATSTLIGDDARSFKTPEPVNTFITSPPYLNGTNYGRNTKLELLTLGFMSTEEELSNLRRREITAGINNVTKRETGDVPIPARHVFDQLVNSTYDKRIPTMVAAYFRDMERVLRSMRANSASGARLTLDIGDSRYSGVTIPVHRILVSLAQQWSWKLLEEEVLRPRRSFDGTALKQVILHFVAE